MHEQQQAPVLEDADAVVVFSEHKTAAGQIIAEARLNNPATLNSLSLEMIDLLHPALRHWRERTEVVAVLLTGTGDRAFSAGGDIQALYHAIKKNHAARAIVDSYPFDFFEREYRLDYFLHQYPKPVVALGHGIVMGGGLGVFGGSSFRVVTEKSRIALPEITIGLFPDAGATWMLGQMAPHWATFLAVTGSHINAQDALAVGFATHSVSAQHRGDLLPGLLALPWSPQASEHSAQIEQLLQNLTPAELPALQVDVIPQTLSPAADTQTCVSQVQALAGASDWVDKGLAALAKGCPTSIGLVVEQLKRAPSLSIEECLRLEMTLATHCAQNQDFAEGVRALLVDKDGAPQWQHASMAECPEAHIQSHFAQPWRDNPLADLGENS